MGTGLVFKGELLVLKLGEATLRFGAAAAVEGAIAFARIMGTEQVAWTPT